mmetsp:Transcript_45341/g.66779  ORF Transcript_45341/g.66779 Transcript_45341/m.66779 type:complete len:563 (+) Transcript_45341:167-1855(+)
MTEFKKDARKSVKKGIDSDGARRRRTDTTIKLRKEKKTEGLAKRRAMTPTVIPVTPVLIPPEESHQSTSMNTNTVSSTAVNISSAVANSKRLYTVAEIPLLMQKLSAEGVSDEEILDAVRGFRRMLSMEYSPPVREVIDCGVLPTFVSLLSRNDFLDIQFEASWALTNVASTEYTRVIVDIGAVPPLVALLTSPSADVREQSAWCLGNVAGDSPVLRDHVLQSGAMGPILQNIVQPASQSLLGNVVWALSNFCRGKPQPDLALVESCIPHLAYLLQNEKKDIVMDACWALSYLSDGDDDRIQTVINGGVVPLLVSLLERDESSIITPVLRTLGNCVSGSDDQTQVVIDSGFLQHLRNLLAHSKRNIRKETCWLISNIAAGTKDQIGSLISMPRELSVVVSLIQTAEWEVRKEALWVVSNIATGGSDIQIQLIVELGAIEALCEMLTVADAQIVMVSLEAIENILKLGEKLMKAYDQLVDESDGLTKIEGLQEHENDDIYKKAVEIIERFYGDDEMENENLAPTADGNSFAFGVTQKAFGGDGTTDQNQQAPIHYSFAAPNQL